MSGQDPNHIKNWFVNRYLWSAQKGILPPAQIANLETAISCFKWVNSNYNFLRVDHMNNDIIISTPQGDIELEQLSAGYISMVTVLIGIINEIEYRNRENPISVSDFEGVVIIDELDVHLHPSMQTAMKIYYRVDSSMALANPSAALITAIRGHLLLAMLRFDFDSGLWNGSSKAPMCHRIASISSSVISSPHWRSRMTDFSPCPIGKEE